MYLISRKQRINIAFAKNKVWYLEQVLVLSEPLERLLHDRGWDRYQIFRTMLVPPLEQLKGLLHEKYKLAYQLMDDLTRRQFRFDDIDVRVSE
jgi:hypothetical protein